MKLSNQISTFFLIVAIQLNRGLCKRITKRQLYREQVQPHSGGKIPESAFETDRLILNRLQKEGIAIPDGIILEQRNPKVYPYSNNDLRPVFKVISDNLFMDNAGVLNPLPVSETTYPIPRTTEERSMNTPIQTIPIQTTVYQPIYRKLTLPNANIQNPLLSLQKDFRTPITDIHHIIKTPASVNQKKLHTHSTIKYYHHDYVTSQFHVELRRNRNAFFFTSLQISIKKRKIGTVNMYLLKTESKWIFSILLFVSFGIIQSVRVDTYGSLYNAVEPAKYLERHKEPEQDLHKIPGIPGHDYPIYHEVPPTSFHCGNVPAIPGMYANVETGCQSYHVCHEGHPESSFLCTNGTIFNQKEFTCDWWYNVDCNQAPSFYNLNADPEHNPYFPKKKVDPLQEEGKFYVNP
ncbi:uncharacterized protein LOC116340513 [Contarinia nasturtii]|uniref:uncharacterized protein LOC116340513 n=1 Tax=Contarinia nasturtii TaxID=265458 RepID=UPI0012D3EDA4|nr:uncharacterized protein LOC116340513 [Contarinia nasturtii]